MGSAAASLTFSQNNTPMSQYQNDLSEHAKVGPMNQSYVVPRPFMVQPASFSNEMLRPLNAGEGGKFCVEDRLAETILEVYWKVEADEII
jgi:hypothetical protein